VRVHTYAYSQNVCPAMSYARVPAGGMAAAAAATATKKARIAPAGQVPSVRSNPKSFCDLIQQHMQLAMGNELGTAQKELLSAMMLFTPYAEYRMCTLPRDDYLHVHACVVREDAADGVASSDVMECGCTKQPLFPLIAKPPVNPQQVIQYHAEWTQCALDEKVALSVRPINKAELVRLRRAECLAWMSYCTVMFNTVRPHVIRCFQDQLKAQCAPAASEFERVQAVNKAGGSKLSEYKILLAKWEIALHGRVPRVLDRKRIMDMTTPTWCFMHQKPGHLIPLRGYQAYSTDCYTCPSLHLAHVAKVQPAGHSVALLTSPTSPPPPAASAAAAAAGRSRYTFAQQSYEDEDLDERKDIFD
jgi:hypothetical protein